MSEWEEFCDSKGMNAGSEEDYEGWLNSLDEPKSAFTPKLEPAREYKSDMTLEALIAIVRRSALGNPKAEFRFETWGWDLGVHAEIDESAMQGIGYDSNKIHRFVIRIQENTELYVSLKLLVDALRTTLLPVEVSNSILAWNTENQCLDSANCWHVPKPGIQHKDSKMTADQGIKLATLLDRMRLTEHGFKPILINRRDLSALAAGEWLNFVRPSDLNIENIPNYVLAYFNRKGLPKYIPMEDVLSVTSHIPTRIGTFYLDQETLTNTNDNAAELISSALKVVTRQRGINFGNYYFVLKEGCTIFEPAFKRITQSELSGFPSDRIYVTDGPHPLGPCTYVTTMAYVEDMQERQRLYNENNSDPLPF